MDFLIRNSIDNNIKAIQDFIRGYNKQPVQLDDNIYSSDKFGKLGEQYIMCLFDEANITKLSAKKIPSPDFKICINGKDFLLETKIIRNLYKNIYHLIHEIARRGRKTISKKIKTLSNNYNFNINPFEIHIKDEKRVKKELRKIINEIYLPLDDTVSFSIKCKSKNYILSIESIKNEGMKFPIDWLTEETTSLWNLLSKKREQIGNSDILSIVLTNSQINYIDLMDFFYPQVKLSLDTIEGINKNNRISQYNYDRSIWRLKFKNNQGDFSTVDEKLKCIIVIFPSNKKALIFTSIKHFDNFSRDEYIYLKELLENKGFRLIWTTHEAELLPKTSSP
jgi:hypothetical protein